MNTSTCKHCDRGIVEVDGAWIDPAATGDDSIWRETCDANHEDRIAAHEPTIPASQPRYPAVEDPDNGLYLRPQTSVTVLTTTVNDPSLPPSAPPRVTEAHYVDATEFMAVQKEADDYRRTLAFINAWRFSDQDRGRLNRLLDDAGFTPDMGHAVNDILGEFSDPMRLL